MPTIAKRTVEEVRYQSDVAEVIGSYLTLKRSGATFKTLCPFHKEKTPSFHVNPQRQIFHCFGCGTGGDVFKFVMQHEGVDFVTAVRMLAQRAGIRIDYEEGGSDTGASDRSTLYDMLEQAADFYRRVLTKSAAGAAGREYLQKRKLSDETVGQFMIGYAPDRWDTMVTWARKNKLPVERLEACGLVVKSTKHESQFYDRFRDRVMFPVRNTQGRVAGFSGRTLKGDGEAKYVNSPETELFHKGQLLYGLYEARRAIVERREAILVEGQIDVIRCHQGGFNAAVAAQGTAFTDDHARIIRRSADAVVISFDSDNAGRAAAIKAAKVFIRSGLAVRLAMLPDGEDPDSLIRDKGPEAFKALLDGAFSAVEFQIRTLSAEGNARSEAGLMRLSKAVLETVAQSPDAVQRSAMIDQVSRLTGIPQDALHDELRQAARRVREPAGARDESPDRGAEAERPREEVELAEHVVAAPALGALVDKYLPLDWLSDTQCAALIRAAIGAAREKRDLMAVVAENDDTARTLSSFAAKVQMAPTKVVGADFPRDRAVKDLILYIHRRELSKRRKDLQQSQREGKGGADDEISARIAELTNDLRLMKSWETALPLLEMAASAEAAAAEARPLKPR